ncbi:hypothetical protein GCM10028796_32740 [Ramlibacter monticola]|uniref:YjbH domain-containing protein n=1 Tax=Ramlibacter monticola TaxID=1926872 RepID=A0A936Z3I1_9BURK|nr:YjbH domain-containing protein [Ramlibacter monticola]MBL0394153.1 YjbH domain-containing protein [Ramlibacter monticola]
MKHFSQHALAAAAALVCCTAGAVDTNLATGGFTGLSLTPNARILEWGQLGLVYDRQLPGAADPSGHNFLAGFGLLPSVELVGRLATNSIHDNCFTQGCGMRDLSASGKVGIGLDRANRFRIAAGITDVGGSVTFFRSAYGVLTYSRDTVEVSGGYARRSGSGTVTARSPLDGVFGSAAWQPLSWARGHVEYTDGNAWAGVRLFAPASWLPQGWAAHVGANARLTNATVTDRTWFSAGITIPLYKVPELRSATPAPLAAPAPAAVPSAPVVQTAPVVGAAPVPPQAPAASPAPAPVRSASDADLEALARDLQSRGLEDIWVGRLPDGSIAIRANNATYNWNAVDALGAALGATASSLGAQRTVYRLVLTQRQVPLVAVTGQADCLRQWIEQPASTCAGGELSTPGTLSMDAVQQGAAWVVRGLQPSWKTFRVQLSPVLRTAIGTEVGAFDYSAGVNVGFSQPLWAGATADWRIQGEVAHSDDFGPGGVFERRHVLQGTERLALTQTVQFPLSRWLGGANEAGTSPGGLSAVSAQGTIGRMGHHFDGVHGSLRWEPGQGRHRWTAQGGWFHNSKFGLVPGEPETATPLLLSYRYNLNTTRTYLEATGGRFMNNDAGLQLGMRQWFGDVAVQVYVRRTSFSNTNARSFAGLELSVPIGPRRDMQPSAFQVTGTPRFSHSIETQVNADAPGNPIVVGLGVLPPAPSIETVYNSDRASLVYFESNLGRIRDAAR